MFITYKIFKYGNKYKVKNLRFEYDSNGTFTSI